MGVDHHHHLKQLDEEEEKEEELSLRDGHDDGHDYNDTDSNRNRNYGNDDGDSNPVADEPAATNGDGDSVDEKVQQPEQELPSSSRMLSLSAAVTPTAVCHRWRRRRRSSSSRRNRRNSKAVAYQGILYTVAFLCTHLLDLIACVLYQVGDGLYFLNLDLVAYMIFQPSL